MSYSTDYHSYRHYGQGTYRTHIPSRKEEGQAGRQSTGYFKSILTVVGLGALAGGAVLAYRAYEKDAALMKTVKPSDCTKGLRVADELFFPHHTNQVLKNVFDHCPASRELAASKMYRGEAREEAYAELSQEQLNHKNPTKALEFAQKLRGESVRDGLLQKIAEASPDQEEKAYDQMSQAKKEAAYENLIDSFIKTPKEGEAIRILDTKIESGTQYRRIRNKLIDQMGDPDLRFKLAKRLPNDSEKDNAFLKIAKDYAWGTRCNHALDVAGELNVDNTEEAVRSLRWSIASNREIAHRLNTMQLHLEKAEGAQHDRLNQVAAICGDEQTRIVAAKAKNSATHRVNSEINYIHNNAPILLDRIPATIQVSPVMTFEEYCCDDPYGYY